MQDRISIDLHIHEDLLPGDYLKESIASFVEMMEGFSEDLADGQAWLFSVESGSSVVRASLEDSVDKDTQLRVVSDVQDAVVEFSRGREPGCLSKRTIQRYHNLSKTVNKRTGTKVSLDIHPSESGPSNVTYIEPYLSNGADEQPPQTPSISKVDGVVKGIHGAKEHYLDVYEDFTGRRVKVKFDNRFSDSEIGDLYMRRIHVVGTTTMDNSGTKVISASIIDKLPSREETPRWSDLVGILEG